VSKVISSDGTTVHHRAQLGGALISLAGMFILMGIITAETQYPRGLHYSTFANEISDLGGTVPPNSIITQPSAHIFDWTLIVTGLMLIVGVICVHEAHHRKLLTIPAVLLGIGVLGVGLFPGNHHDIHRTFSMATFLFGGLAATFSWKATEGLFRYITLLLGVTSLFFLVAGTGLFEGTLGVGGLERWIAYPIVMWMVLFGGYILGDRSQQHGT
jgi:hypothetical membrane protein